MNQGTDLLRAVTALAFVLGLIWLLGFVTRKYGWKVGLPTPKSAGAKKRLGLVEVLPIDARTKLVLVRHDEVEHLLLVGAQTAQFVPPSVPPVQGTVL